MVEALGFDNTKYSFWAVLGGKKAPDTGLAIPRGLRSFSVLAGTGAVAFKLGPGTAKMTISASLNVPNGRWEEAVKAINQKTYGVAMLAEYDDVVDMLVVKMVADLRLTQ